MAQILIVDDDEIVTAVVGDVLVGAGHSIRTVFHGDDAMKAVRADKPDLLILDYTLPGRTGRDILRHLRTLPSADEMPVMMLTSRHGRVHSGIAEVDGADDYVTKPFDPADLLLRAEALLAAPKTLRRATPAVATTHQRHNTLSQQQLAGTRLVMARIIIADDDEIVGHIAQDALIAAGHGVGLLGNGADALVTIKCKKPDVVILDCNMPRLSGLLVLRAMRNSLSLFSIPVLILTGRQSKRDAELARYEGANEYMTKPFDPDELVFRVEELLAQPRRPASL